MSDRSIRIDIGRLVLRGAARELDTTRLPLLIEQALGSGSRLSAGPDDPQPVRIARRVADAIERRAGREVDRR
jgi:hypothetical protein